MDVVALIIAEHDEIADLFDRLERSEEQEITRDASVLVRRLAVVIKLHARSEERVVYEAMRTRGRELAELALDGHYEHEVLEVLTDRLISQHAADELRAMLRVARGLFEHHARDEEEGFMLPRLEAAIDAPERAVLGRDFIVERQRRQPVIERLLVPRALGLHAHRR